MSDDKPNQAAPSRAVDDCEGASPREIVADPKIVLPAGASASRRRGRQFAPGTSGNPAGRPRGARNKVTEQVAAMFGDASQAIAQRLIEGALKGDPTCLKIIAPRIYPLEREPAIELDLPRIETTDDCQRAIGCVIEAVARGEITPSQGRTLSGLIATHRHGAEIADLEERLRRLEAEQRRMR